MLRKLLIALSLALVLAAPAAAQRVTLMPGVTYERGVQFTPHGPVALHIVTGPRPTGLYALRPVLSNEAIEGRERVTAMQKRLSATATMVGVNGDLFNWETGRPSGVLMRDGVVESPPYGDRSSVGITAEGALDVRRVEFFGTWRGLGQRRTVNDMNEPPGVNGVSLFTPSYGPATPALPGTVAVVIAPFPPAIPNTDLYGPVVAVANGSGTAIPRDGAVLVARGPAAQRLTEEAPIGTEVALRVILRPDWTGIMQGIGGGPVLVRNRGPVFRSNEAFSPSQLVPRNPRTAVGQLANGRVILVATDGRQPGYSVGMTNFELAQTMVRLGAVTASALDAGGSTTLAFEGTLLNRPSDPGGERPVSTSLQLMYYGVFVPAPFPVVSPNGDGVDETQRLSYKVVAPSAVTATLTAPDGTQPFVESIERTPGTYPIAFPPTEPPTEGRWQLDVSATDDQGRASTARQTFTVNNTLGDVKLSRKAFVAREGGRQFVQAGVTLTRPARLTVTVETRTGGVRVATIATRKVEQGRFLVQWNGTTRGGRAFVYGGEYVLRFRAANELGVTELVSRPVRVTVIRAKPRKPKQPKQPG
ncbi:MAG: phosphodiester glycosidase family protein [Actinobacteria bacterium]|nr:phosphodiester glycosidase family protein [Actinomycetota bacterium]